MSFSLTARACRTWDNLVYSPEFGLQIIDFDVAVKLDKDTDMVEDIVGTEGYMAPEIDKERGLAYSPLKADSWSCGWVVVVVVVVVYSQFLYRYKQTQSAKTRFRQAGARQRVVNGYHNNMGVGH